MRTEWRMINIFWALNHRSRAYDLVTGIVCISFYTALFGYMPAKMFGWEQVKYATFLFAWFSAAAAMMLWFYIPMRAWKSRRWR